NNIAAIYIGQGNYDKAREKYFESLKLKKEIGNKQQISIAYYNIAETYYNQGKYDLALENDLESLKLKEEIGDKQGIAASYNHIGDIYFKKGNYDKALENQFASLKLFEKIGAKYSAANTDISIANAYSGKLDYSNATKWFRQAMQLAKEIGSKPLLQDAYKGLSEVNEKMSDYHNAYNYHKLYTDLKDTLLNETSSKQIAEMNTKYDTEKKDKELIQKDAEISKQQAESEKQQIQRNAFIVGFGLVLLLAIFIFRGYRHKREANRMLEIKNEAINKQNEEIEKKNTLITDSIEYAKNIQSAILPSEEELKKHFQDYFILYKPKDIVSGDFYWIHEQEDNLLLAVADCTGHGVPGAFMSLMGHNLLREIVSSKNNSNPSEILDELNLKVLKTLKQDSKNTSAKYGMDIALISMDKKRNTIEFAGAHNPLYIYRNKECIQLKADSRSIGNSMDKEEKGFNKQFFQLQKGDMLYLFSDGYTAQKGGSENKKFFFKPFRELLQGICELEVIEQQHLLNATVLSWQGNKKQTDDILIVGIRA
ncbi:MAG: SpoIIE family protein phosphatase, partial [Bacteroidetes bacterium]|nr:SpoIIE family protein phosphatase [Bacteroidota bacterium]